jgi:hypothetical protein
MALANKTSTAAVPTAIWVQYSMIGHPPSFLVGKWIARALRPYWPVYSTSCTANLKNPRGLWGSSAKTPIAHRFAGASARTACRASPREMQPSWRLAGRYPPMPGSDCRSKVRKKASLSTRRRREDVLGHGGEGCWRFAQGPIEHRAKRHTVLLRDLRAVSLLLRVEKLACLLDCQRREVPDGGCVPSVHRRCQSVVRRNLFGCGQSAASSLSSVPAAIDTVLYSRGV